MLLFLVHMYDYGATYWINKLKKRLVAFYCKRIQIQMLTSQGSPLVVISSEICVGDAALAAGRLTDQLNLKEQVEDDDEDDDDTIKMSMLSSAATILKHKMD